MALSNYGVVKGDFDHFARDPVDDFGRFLHGHIFVRVPKPGGGTMLFDCACDVNTPNGWIEYFHTPLLDPAKFLVVPNLPDGHHFLPTAHASNAPTGGALDYVRNPLISLNLGCAAMVFNFINAIFGRREQVWTKNNGEAALNVLEPMLESGDVEKVYVFGARFDNAQQNPPQGMHDVHYNQGDPPGQFRHLDQIWQDGGVIVRHRDGRYEGFFVKFNTQSLNTDDNGLPR